MIWSYPIPLLSFSSPTAVLIRILSYYYSHSPLIFLSSLSSQTFAKLQSFTSAIRKSKKSTLEDGDGELSVEFQIKHKSAKERAIDKLQELENNDGDNDNGGSGRRGDKEEYEAYNGQVLEGASDDEEVGTDWHKGKLKFRRHITDKLKVGGDGRKLDDYVLIDPRSRQ